MSFASFDHLVELARPVPNAAAAAQRPRTGAQDSGAPLVLEEDLGPPRGIAIGVVLSLPLWAAIYAVIHMIIHYV